MYRGNQGYYGGITPFRQWDEEVLRDVEELMEKQNVSVMLAHIERFYACQKKERRFGKKFLICLGYISG